MKLIWTYNGKPVSIDKIDYKTIIRINLYITSISTAKRMGYETIMYCDKHSVTYFESFVDKIVVLEQYDTPFWDSYKIDVLERETGDYCLIDGDIILHNKLPKFTADVTIDCLEIKTYKYYKPTIQLLTEIGIKDIIPEWEDREQNMVNHGILHFKNEEIKKLYLQKWKLYGEFIIKHRDKIDDMVYASLTSQYLLLLICNSVNASIEPLSHALGKMNKYYTHYAGDMKFDNPKVPSDVIIKPYKKVLI
jgi:hypothetical protein